MARSHTLKYRPCTYSHLFVSVPSYSRSVRKRRVSKRATPRKHNINSSAVESQAHTPPSVSKLAERTNPGAADAESSTEHRRTSGTEAYTKTINTLINIIIPAYAKNYSHIVEVRKGLSVVERRRHLLVGPQAWQVLAVLYTPPRVFVVHKIIPDSYRCARGLRHYTVTCSSIAKCVVGFRHVTTPNWAALFPIEFIATTVAVPPERGGTRRTMAIWFTGWF